MQDRFLHRLLADAFMMALTIYREAANQPYDGQVAVGHVIMTRANHPSWEGHTPYEVITKKEQFSSITHLGDPMTVRWPSQDDLVFQRCMQIATGVYEGQLPNPAPGADHYCTKAVAGMTKWANPGKVVAIIGDHIFYNLDGDPAEQPAVKRSA